MDLSVEKFKNWFASHRESVFEDFFTFLRFPSISTDPEHDQDSRNTAQWLCDYLRNIGLDAELWQTPGMPVVFASHLKAGPSRPTVLIYNHYDVQPVDPLELWKSDPFEPEIRNDQVFARGALDNKGQCFYTLTALKALFDIAEQIDINLKVFIEGEEESASKGTAAILNERQNELQADYLLVIDFGIPDAKTPAITLGMRGIVTLEVECKNSSIDLHSGSHGGIALNPNRALVGILSSLWDANGRVAIPHFYDEVTSLPSAHLSSLDMSFDKQAYTKAFGVTAFCREQGYSIVESNWLRPVIEINGMWGGYTGAGFKTVIPSKAFAKISCRLVPDQEPMVIGERITQFLKAKAPEGIVIHTEVHHGAPGFRSAFDARIVPIVAKAYTEIFHKPCRYQLCGASVPIITDLARVCGAEVALMGVGLDSDDIHAPNEHFGTDRFELGYLTVSRILSLLSEGN